VVVAVPLAAHRVCSKMERAADRAVCLETPTPFQAVGAWYREFPQTTDEGAQERAKEYWHLHGRRPPTFLTISPTKRCNLRCTGCYAATMRRPSSPTSFSSTTST
jgi:hypothetical protein